MASISFQCKDILSRDIFSNDSNNSEEGSSGYDSDKSDHGPVVRGKLAGRKFQILLFGSDAEGKSVCLQVNNFRPFFFLRIPDCLADNEPAIKHLRRWVLNAVEEAAVSGVELTIERHKTLFDYNASAYGTFLKITTVSQVLWRHIKNRLLNKSSEPIAYNAVSLFGKVGLDILNTAPGSDDVASFDGQTVTLKVYEANIDPVLRFFHIQNVSPAGWITVGAERWQEVTGRDAKVAVSVAAEWTDVCNGAAGGMAPFLVASWDIECTSSHGDFPLAAKTWRKPVREWLESGSVPSSLKEFCTEVADAIHGESPTLSRVYLKHAALAKSYGAETIQQMIETRKTGKQILSALHELAAAVGLKGDARDDAVSSLDKVLTATLPAVAGDEIIQIGTVLYRRGAAVSKHIWVLGTVDRDAVKPPGVDVPVQVYSYASEGEMLRAWFRWIGSTAPDVMIGYNIFGFDSEYIWLRLKECLGNEKEAMNAVSPLSCLRSRPCRLEEKFLSSSAMGDNTMMFLSSPGRLQVDLLPYIRRNHNLDSYSLDNVSATFVSGNIKGALKHLGGTSWMLATKSTKGIVAGRYITLMDEENDRIVQKAAVTAVDAGSLTIELKEPVESRVVRWAQVKDDVSPKDIFRLHRGTARDRAIVARYCLQDCDLVMELFNKLEILNNTVAMADVCSVPVSYIFLRGQGIKIESLIFRECRSADQLIEVMSSPPRESEDAVKPEDNEDDEEEDSYEGAIVLEPNTGVYLDDPVTADDFASLYPSSIISENISHDTLIWVKDYDNDGNFVCVREGSERYDNIPDAKYVNIEFDILRTDPADKRKHPAKVKDGVRVARYIQQPQGTIPRILEMLLASRKKCRKLAETEPDEFRRALLDAQQLAYKLTANSLYGQLGSGVFKIRRQTLAASTTAYGRKQLMYAKAVIERVYGGGADPRCDVECVYGDTDSIFLRFRPKDPVTGERLHGAAALKAAKDLTVESGKLVTSCLKPPHDFEFDKIFRSFCLLSKKRYVGDMSEDGLEDDDFHRKSMGIVMKRRDNAPIVKYVYGGMVDRILGCTDVQAGVQAAYAFVRESARELLSGKFPMTKLTITKSLRSEYKDPTRIAHKVLADRIAQRDPGNKPSTSDRIPYVYVSHGAGPVPELQGDRIELPSYIKEHNLTPDYPFYVTNQIAKPVAQMFGLVVEHIPGVLAADVAACKRAKKPVEAREKLAMKLLFDNVLQQAAQRPENMAKKGQHSIASMFAKAASKPIN
jgi:DNA polymerase elongation subunit (family B)